ncbi:MAG: hypothetical protein R2843_00565 [Thermomicrobiales bacterium]
MIFEHERGDCARRREFGQPADAEGFAMNALRTREPVDLNAEFLERLFHYPGFAGRPFDEHGAIRDPARKDGDARRFARIDLALVMQPRHQDAWLLDVECRHG